jgi:hypothetical protein
MMKRLNACLSVIALAAVILAASGSPLCAQDDTKIAPSIAGTWTMTVMSHQVGMVLAQDGTKVTGTFMLMGKDVPVEGEFVDGTLTLTSNARIMTPQTENAQALHGGATPPGTPLTIKGKLQDDGTLAAEMPGGSGQPLTFVAERLKERKVRAAAAAAATGPGVTGAWKMVAMAPQGIMELNLSFKQNGEKVTGTLWSEHTGELALEGTFANGTLKFSSGGSDPHSMPMNYKAALAADGTLSGELTSAEATMKWTAERVKK